ncbi:MAG: Flp family type IVb pilin [Methylocystis sp.]|nr:MAG: Flp family type IVb pilin [Methylocystis sp.]
MTLTRFLNDEKGTTLVEYAAIASMASILIIGGARGIGVNLAQNHFGALLRAMGW